MNKQKLIKQLEMTKDLDSSLCNTCNEGYRRGIDFALELTKQLEEPQEQPKIKVPKEFDEWYQEIKLKYKNDFNAKSFALWKLCQQGFGHGFENVNHSKIEYDSKLGKWLKANEALAIDAIFYGYEEHLYNVKIPVTTWNEDSSELEMKYAYLMFDITSDETRISGNGKESIKWKGRLTESQIKGIDERYWSFAVPVEEETK